MKHREGARVAATGLMAVCGIFGVATAPAANAHDAVVGGTPTDGQVLQEFPQSIVLDFSATPKEGFNTMAVTSQDGKVLFSGEPTLNGNELTLAVPGDVRPGDGAYNVGFQITSSDGHATRGKISFTVSSTGEATASGTSSTSDSTPVTSAASENASGSSNSGLMWGLGAAIVVVLGAVAALFKRKKS